MPLLPRIATLLTLLVPFTEAVNGGSSGRATTTYTGAGGRSIPGGLPAYRLRNPKYEYTGLGTSETNVFFLNNGSLAFAPAISPAGLGYAVSNDVGKSWSQVLPTPDQPRIQPIMRQIDQRLFFWSSNPPGLQFSYSDDQGSTWTTLNGSHFDPLIQDWAKLVSGKPVSSKLTNGAKQILYLSAPSLISTPIPVEPVGPINQYIMKSTDGGNTWTPTQGRPTLQPLLSGGACSGLVGTLAGQELIIWGDGFVMPNGTVVFGLRRCQKLSLAFSDDEGDSWRLVDVPGSSLPPFFPGDLTYLLNGNVLVPDPISMDVSGTFYSIWSDANYALQMSVSSDSGNTWTNPIVVAAPNSANFLTTTMTYLPKLRQHPTIPGRALLAYYGSEDGGKTYNGYVAETGNLKAANPVFSSVIINPVSAPLQHNQDGQWDQGYGDPLYDLDEFLDVKYTPTGDNNIVAAFARRMCTAHSVPPQVFDRTSCVDGWDFDAHGQSQWQGFFATVSH